MLNPYEIIKASELLHYHIPSFSEDMAQQLYIAGVKGGEISSYDYLEEWVKTRVIPSLVVLSQDDYVIALTHALRIAPKLAGSDFGSSRQRDISQLWTDSARGFLGELALKKLFTQRFNVELALEFAHEPTEDYIPSSIKRVISKDGVHSLGPNIVNLKTTKYNGVWLDIPGQQIERSRVFIQVKLGIMRHHFIGFLKMISFVKDKLLPWALHLGTIDEDEANNIINSLPEFNNIPCYIPGFLYQNDFLDGKIKPLYRQKHKRNGNISYVMQSYVGPIKDGRPLSVPENIISSQWEFQSIGKFSAAKHHLSNTGSLRYTETEWEQLMHNIKI